MEVLAKHDENVENGWNEMMKQCFQKLTVLMNRTK